MPAGIEVINNHGTVLISDRDPVLIMRSKQTVNHVPSGTLPTRVTLTFSNCSTPIFAIRSSVLSLIEKVVRSGTNAQVTVVSFGTTADVATVYHFDKPLQPAATGGYGIQVFDASGNCTFDSMQKNAVVVAINPPTGTWTGTVGRIYAMAWNSAWTRHVIQQTDLDWYNEFWYGNMARMSNHQVIVDNNFMYYAAYNVPGSSITPIDIETGERGGVIIDVTSY